MLFRFLARLGSHTERISVQGADVFTAINTFSRVLKGSIALPIDARSSSQSHATFSWFLLISANILWATSYVAGKLALSGGTSVILMLALRMSISALILLPLLIAKRKEIKLSRQDLPQLALLSCIGWLALMAWFQGLSKVDGSVAASTLFIQPLLGTLLALSSCTTSLPL